MTAQTGSRPRGCNRKNTEVSHSTIVAQYSSSEVVDYPLDPELVWGVTADDVILSTKCVTNTVDYIYI